MLYSGHRPAAAWDHPNIEYVVGDLCDAEAVAEACKGVDCVFHIAAAVGPFHPRELYRRVNYDGTLNVINGCKRHGVPKLVMSSSPSTRFDGSDVDGLREDQMPELPLAHYMQEYAETKAMGELACRQACCDELMTVAVAPHQVRLKGMYTKSADAVQIGRTYIFAASQAQWKDRDKQW